MADAYRPLPHPIHLQSDDLRFVAAYVYNELVQLQTALDTARDFDVETRAPDDPKEGWVRYADGTNWDPGSGKGLYVYDGTSWVAL